MYIKDNKDLPPNIIWIEEDKAKILLKYFPELSRRINSKKHNEIAFMDNKEVRDKINELKLV